MNDYRRFIAYVYAYYQEEKRQNVGFLKVEKRGNHVKMQGNIRIHQRYEMEENYQLYLLFAKGTEWWRIPVEAMSRRANAMEIDVEAVADNVLDTGYRIEHTAGIQIVGESESEEKTFFAALWVNERPNWKMLKGDHSQIQEIVQTESPSILQLLEDYAEEQGLYEEEQPEKLNEQSQPEENKQPEEFMEQSQPEENKQPEEFSEQSQTAESEKDTSQDLQIESEEEILEKLWQEWSKLYGKCRVPFNQTELTGIKIQLADFERFPSKLWDYASNPFILHGYYYFRHILLAKDCDNEFYIGVPGVYHDRERVAAAIFGFGDFGKMPSQEGIEGQFGYWLHCV